MAAELEQEIGADLLRTAADDIISIMQSGDAQLSVQVGTVLPLSQAAEAHRLLEGRKTTGKVVLQPWEEAG